MRRTIVLGPLLALCRNTTTSASGLPTLTISNNAPPLQHVLGGTSAALHTLLCQEEVSVGPTGHASRHRLVNNMSCNSRPWEPSCVEIRNTKKHDEVQERLAHQSPSGRTRAVNIPRPAVPLESSTDDPVEVVFYFETSNDEGLRGFQRVAEQVLRGELPGECRNTTGQGGFATWSVPRPQFMLLMAPMLEGHQGKPIHPALVASSSSTATDDQ